MKDFIEDIVPVTISVHEKFIIRRIKVDIICHEIDKGKIFFLLKIRLADKDKTDISNSNDNIIINLRDIRLSIFGFEYIKGSFTTNVKSYNLEKLDNLPITLSKDEQTVLTYFDINKDYIDRVNKIMANIVTVKLKIKFYRQEGPINEYEYLTRLYYILSWFEWVKIIFRIGYLKPGYYMTILNIFLRKYLIKAIIVIIIVSIILKYKSYYEIIDMMSKIWKFL